MSRRWFVREVFEDGSSVVLSTHASVQEALAKAEMEFDFGDACERINIVEDEYLEESE